MVFTSLPLYHLDPQNWHQQQANDHQQLLVPTHHDSTVQLTPPPQQPPNHGGGSGGPMSSIKPNSMVDRARQAQIPLPEPGLKCPRCESTNTKFCYFNNYSLSQPRHFCKTCRRYWTRGGALRSVPVGGGSRRTTKRSKGKSSGGTTTSSNANNGSSSASRSTMITTSTTSEGASSCSTSLFLTPNNLPQFPFMPSSLHHLGNSSPSGIGLSLLGAPGVEMEFPLMGGFEGLGRINGMHPFENPASSGSFELLGGRLLNNHHHHHHVIQSKPLDLHHEFMIDRVGSVKLEDSQGLNLLAKDFTGIHHGNYNWNNNNNVWTNTDLSGFTSSSNSHLLG